MSAQQLAAWRAGGAWRLDPARFHALEALARRLPAQSEAVQVVLRPRLQQGLEAYAQRLAATQPAAIARKFAAPASPLKQLNAEVQAARAERNPPVASGEAGAADELGSVRRFRQSWERQRSLEQAERALGRKPANAGPLNSHALVLQAVDLMRELSPDYLRHFVAQAETLLWLQAARDKLPRAPGRKPAKVRR